ncbi:MAG: Smr/MutS family protein [Myxococcales bacterium]|nr:Smr/MutS family protein [Myxococcales bacterium]
MAKHREPPKKEKKPEPASDGFRTLAGPLAAIAAKAKAEEKAKEEARKAAAKQAPGKPGAKAPVPVGKAPTTAQKPVQKPAMGPKAKTGNEDAPAPIEDEFFYRRMMAGVVPLGGDGHGRLSTAVPKAVAPKPATPARDPDEDVRDQLLNLVEGAARFEVTDDGRRLEGHRLDLGEAAMRRLRRGELPIDARIDLHGKRAEEAKEALEVFLRDRRQRRARTVLVIHGRGDHSPAGVGVLRGEIAAWLSQGRSSQHVAAFATAIADDGGDGALYVLLRP